MPHCSQGAVGTVCGLVIGLLNPDAPECYYIGPVSNFPLFSVWQVPPALARFLLWRVADIWFCQWRPFTESSSVLAHSQWVSWYLCPANIGGYVSRNGAAGGQEGMKQAPVMLRGKTALTLTSPCQKLGKQSRSCVRHRQQETFLMYTDFFLKMTFCLMSRGRNCACDQVDQSHSSISSHIPELCLSLSDPADNVSY